MKIKSYKDLEKIRKEGLLSLYPVKSKITVGIASCGLASGAGETYEAIESEITNKNLDVILKKTGCLGFCQMEPLVEILEPGKPKLIYKNITHDKVEKLIDSFIEGKIAEDLILLRIDEDEIFRENGEIEKDLKKLWTNDKNNISNEIKNDINKIPLYKEIPFFKKQKKIVLRNCGFINPEDIKEYIAKGGYYSLYKALNEMSSEEVIEEIKNSKLRGRGGAGFPTGIKWEFTRKAEGNTKYVICNADEGDPGAYMDRTILESDPHSVIEGMIIGAFAIGANEGYIYVRNEYPLAVKRLQLAIAQAEEMGLLGKNIFDSNFNFSINIYRGAGAFVCGEETALLASIEGKTGEPKTRPPFPAQSGLWGKPTVINNVKTWANIPPIISHGSKWFYEIGTEETKGTMVFSLVGNIKNTGLVEIPAGISLNELIYDIGGGIPNNKKLKAVQTGGPSGGCIPYDLCNIKIDYKELVNVGSIMGSGGMVVMDSDNCMVDVAKFFLAFTMDESCGKCTPCREGIKRMHEILTNITNGNGKKGDIELLEEVAEQVKNDSLCALGGTAPNPVLTTIRYFRDEYKSHIDDKRCTAKVCKALITFYINDEKCNGCGVCLKECPQNAISGEKKRPHKIDEELCIKCGICKDVCKFDAVYVK
jgi:NADH:ubiquinone oxidoreductase subunit F (NADH-binding)/(2Fe-2S) ferredoxin/NAD-dependent dihydropyrimidine dehydrogenase PreA subunit